MKSLCISIIMLLPVATFGFTRNNKVALSVIPTFLKSTINPGKNDITINPFNGFKGVDIDRAKECAQNFGKCSIQEMEQLKSNLHKERLQYFVFGGSNDAIEHFALEEELELQMGLLKHHDSLDVSLFPIEMESPLPHIKDVPFIESERHKDTPKSFIHKPTPSQVLAIEETILEENVLEAFMFCLVLASFMIVPQLI